MNARGLTVRSLPRLVGCGLVALALSVPAFDQQTALPRKTLVDLAVAHVRAEYQKYPQAALPGLDFEHPQVLARNAAHGRRLVFVSFASKLARWGQYETFELCAHSARIERVDSGRVDDIDLYRATVSAISPATPNRLPAGCGSARA